MTYHEEAVEILEAPIGNYYGNVAAKQEGGKCYMGVGDWNGKFRWTEISHALYDEFVKQFAEDGTRLFYKYGEYLTREELELEERWGEDEGADS